MREIRASHILVGDRAKAENSARLLKKEDFAARPGPFQGETAARGGDTGSSRGSPGRGVEDALFKTREGRDVRRGGLPYGIPLDPAHGERPLADRPLDDAVKAEIRKVSKNQRLPGLVRRARRRVPVRTDDARLADLSIPAKDGPRAALEPSARGAVGSSGSRVNLI